MTLVDTKDIFVIKKLGSPCTYLKYVKTYGHTGHRISVDWVTEISQATRLISLLEIDFETRQVLRLHLESGHLMSVLGKETLSVEFQS